MEELAFLLFFDIDVIGTRYKKGQLVRGEAHDARKAPLFFDGNLLHFTRSFQGSDRYAAVFCCQDTVS
jgi:hypothetical protein